MAVRLIDANVAMKKIQGYMDDFPKAFTWFATCQVILSILGMKTRSLPSFKVTHWVPLPVPPVCSPLKEGNT